MQPSRMSRIALLRHKQATLSETCFELPVKAKNIRGTTRDLSLALEAAAARDHAIGQDAADRKRARIRAAASQETVGRLHVHDLGPLVEHVEDLDVSHVDVGRR